MVSAHFKYNSWVGIFIENVYNERNTLIHLLISY